MGKSGGCPSHSSGPCRVVVSSEWRRDHTCCPESLEEWQGARARGAATGQDWLGGAGLRGTASTCHAEVPGGISGWQDQAAGGAKAPSLPEALDSRCPPEHTRCPGGLTDRRAEGLIQQEVVPSPPPPLP